MIRNLLARKWGDVRQLKPSRLIMALILGGAAAVAVANTYGWAARTNLLGDRARAKYEAQAGSRFGLLLGGRAEFVSGVIAVVDSPIIGFGSWPLDTRGYYTRMCEAMNVKPDPRFYKSGYPVIPTHSHLLQAWVENGLGGGIFWAYVLFFVVRQLYRPMVHESELRLWATNAAIAAMWAILFSPISDRLNMAFTLAMFARESAALRTVLRQPAGARQPTTSGTTGLVKAC
jgi:O-antigen ligase